MSIAESISETNVKRLQTRLRRETDPTRVALLMRLLEAIEAHGQAPSDQSPQRATIEHAS